MGRSPSASNSADIASSFSSAIDPLAPHITPSVPQKEMPSCHPLQFDFIILKQGWPQFNTIPYGYLQLSIWNYHLPTPLPTRESSNLERCPAFLQMATISQKALDCGSATPGSLCEPRLITMAADVWTANSVSGRRAMNHVRANKPLFRIFLGKKKNPTTRAPTTSIGFPEDRRVHIKNNFILSSAV